MRFDIFSIFPQMFDGPFSYSIIQRARETGLAEIHLHNIRDYARDKHHMTDDTPYGGGGGMIMKPDPIFYAVESVLGLEVSPEGYTAAGSAGRPPVILLSPQGRVFNQQVVEELGQYPRLMFICGRYEGVDERVVQYLATDRISIGDYVLSGGEIPAMVIVDALIRQIPGALGDPAATANDSHATGLLEYPHYTRPPEFRGHAVPDILLSGHHAKMNEWRRRQALLRTLRHRPDMLASAPLTDADRKFLKSIQSENDH